MLSSRLVILLLALSLLPGPVTAWGQLEVESTQVNQLTGVEGIISIGDVVLFRDASEINLQPGVMLKVTTEAANVEIDVTDRDRRRVPFVELASEDGTSIYLVSEPGKAWVEVTVIDFAKNIYRRQGLQVDVPQGSPIGPAPGPAPDPPSEPLLSLIKPIRDKLASDPEKAFAVGNAFAGFASAVAVAMPSDVATFIAVNRKAIEALAVPSGVRIGADVDKVLSEYVGFEKNDAGDWKDRPLVDDDRKKLIESYQAISYAARVAK